MTKQTPLFIIVQKAMSEILLQLKNLHKRFGTVPVLQGISLDIAQGEFITLLGASGCGKTTTLRIIAGLEDPDEGEVWLGGKNVTAEDASSRDVNTVFQNYALFPHMTVAENIGYGLKLRRTARNEIKKRVEEMLHLVQLDGFERRRPSELSGGQKQRVAIARAVINRPKVLLLDEPLGALDLKLRRQMQLELKRLQQRLGITFIYITHDQEEAINMSDRIAVMHRGVFEQIGTPNEIYYAPRTSYVAGFVGSANIIRQDGCVLAVRSENILFGGEGEYAHPAVVKEKSFNGGQLRILFVLDSGQEVTASRYGIDADVAVGERLSVGWLEKDAAAVADDGT